LNRTEAIAILREVVDSQIAIARWVSLDDKSDTCKLLIKGEVNSQSLKLVVQNHNLAVKESKGLFTIYSENAKS